MRKKSNNINLRSKNPIEPKDGLCRCYFCVGGSVTWAEHWDPDTNLKKSEMSLRLRPRELWELRTVAKFAGTTKTALVRGAVQALASEDEGPILLKWLRDSGYV